MQREQGKAVDFWPRIPLASKRLARIQRSRSCAARCPYRWRVAASLPIAGVLSRARADSAQWARGTNMGTTCVRRPLEQDMPVRAEQTPPQDREYLPPRRLGREGARRQPALNRALVRDEEPAVSDVDHRPSKNSLFVLYWLLQLNGRKNRFQSFFISVPPSRY